MYMDFYKFELARLLVGLFLPILSLSLSMGALTSSCQTEEAKEQMAKSRAIERQINMDRRAGTSIIKLLLLGNFY